MAYTQGLSFYETDALGGDSITYGFDVLSSADLIVVGINNGSPSEVRVTLEEYTDYTINLETQTIDCTAASWSALPSISGASSTIVDIRVYRSTSSLPLVDFQNGGVLTEQDLDSAYRQALFACQEVSENASGLEGSVTQSVITGMLSDGSVTSSKLATNAVTQSKMADNSVGSAELVNSSVTNAKIGSGAVDTAKLANASVTDDKLATDAVTTVKIVDDAVTYAKVDTATKTEMQGQSAAGIVTPDVLKYSPFSPRCYGSVTFDTATPIVSASYNVQSVADTSTTQRTVTFSNALTDTDYVVIVTAGGTTVGLYATVINKTVNSFVIDAAGDTEGTGRKFDFVVFGSNLLL